MRYGPKSEWKTHLGNTVSIEGMDDTHVANTIQYLETYELNPLFLVALLKEANKRGLGPEYLAKAPYPYKDGKGNWIVWDYENDGPKVVGRYVGGRT